MPAILLNFDRINLDFIYSVTMKNRKEIIWPAAKKVKTEPYNSIPWFVGVYFN